MGLRFMTRIPLVVIGSVIMALVVHIKLGLLLTVTLPFLVIFMIWLMRRASELFRNVQSRLDGVNGVIQENLTGIRLIRVFVRMGHEIGRFATFSGELMRSTIAALRLTETSTPFIMIIVNAGILAVLWFGRIEISTGDATLGQTVAVINYSLRTMGALSALSWIMVSFSRARASSGRVTEVMAASDGPGELGMTSGEGLASAVQGKVEFRQVSFSYAGSDIKVLDDISFTVQPGNAWRLWARPAQANPLWSR